MPTKQGKYICLASKGHKNEIPGSFQRKLQRKPEFPAQDVNPASKMETFKKKKVEEESPKTFWVGKTLITQNAAPVPGQL